MHFATRKMGVIFCVAKKDTRGGGGPRVFYFFDAIFPVLVFWIPPLCFERQTCLSWTINPRPFLTISSLERRRFIRKQENWLNSDTHAHCKSLQENLFVMKLFRLQGFRVCSLLNADSKERQDNLLTLSGITAPLQDLNKVQTFCIHFPFQPPF